MASDSDVLCRAEGALGRITLNRPKVLNALNAAMRSTISAALKTWQRDPMIYAVAIDAEGDRAFCAGGDLHEMHRLAQDDLAAARAMAADEYTLNWQIECYTKPIVSLIDGICMGSGVGLTAFGTHRVAGDNYSLAMPETAIGFFPDVGATWFLGQLPDHAGKYLGLSGRAINRNDAFRLGLVTHCIDAGRFDEIRAGLSDAQPVDALLDEVFDTNTVMSVGEEWARVAEVFAHPSMAAVLGALEADSSEFAKGLWAELESKSPTSLAVTFRQLANTPPEDLGEALRREYRMACRFLEEPDLFEGIRALLIDKDNAPRWQPGALAGVTSASVDSYFAAPVSGDLELPPRPKAIAAIA